MTSENDQKAKADRVGAAAWGLFFLWVGASWLLEIDLGVALLGVASITVLAQAVRAGLALPVEWLWVAVGLCFGLGGLGQIAETDIPLTPILLLGAGCLLFLSAMVGRRRERHQ